MSFHYGKPIHSEGSQPCPLQRRCAKNISVKKRSKRKSREPRPNNEPRPKFRPRPSRLLSLLNIPPLFSPSQTKRSKKKYGACRSF